MELPTYFSEFIGKIRPTTSQEEDMRTGYKTLRDRLEADDDLKNIIISTFLQGSFRRSTAIKAQGDKRSDVDLVVVTNLDKDKVTPAQAFQKFKPFMEKYYKGKYKQNGRSFGIELSYVDLDLVITAAPPQSEQAAFKARSVTSSLLLEEDTEWRLNESWVPPDAKNRLAMLKEAISKTELTLSPLWIPDRDSQKWERTHPIAQIKWTAAKNRRCNAHYVNVVKAIKWWRREMQPKPKYPKGYPVEHLIGVCCPDGITSICKGVTSALENIVTQFAAYAAAKRTPFLADHGVPEHNVFARVSGEEFAAFYGHVKDAAAIARKAMDAPTVKASADAWRELFGDEFPKAPDDDRDSDGGKDAPVLGGYTPRKEVSVIGGGRFA